MTQPSSNRAGRRANWRIAGLTTVLVAIALAVIGCVLALQQTQTLTTRLDAQAREQARQLAHTAYSALSQELTASLRNVLHTYRIGGARRIWSQSAKADWMDGLLLWDGAELSSLDPTSNLLDDVGSAVRELLESRPIEVPIEAYSIRATQVLRIVNGKLEPLAYLQGIDALGSPVVMITRLELAAVKRDLLDPLVALTDGLELVAADRVDAPWSQPMPASLRAWSLQPTAAFIREQQALGAARTLGYLSLTILSVLTLLATMWFLVRVVRREIALAELKSNFVADVSHELKTPLALIQLFAETLQSGRVPTEEKRQEYYAIITRESIRLTNLINKILDFARIESGRKVYALRETNIQDVVRQTYEAYRTELDHKGFAHTLTVEGDLPKVLADPDAIHQVVLNLIANAIKYSQDDRRLDLVISRDTLRGRRGVLLSVRDCGIGIRPEDRAHLFDGFFRSTDRRVRKKRGTGLGLALVKHIVDAHEGSLDVESRLVKGTTFRIFLPAMRQEAATDAAGS